MHEKGLYGYAIPFCHVRNDKYIDLDNIEMIADAIFIAITKGLK
jgi:hypothetical protein